MNVREDIKSITYMKTQSAKLLENVSKNHRSVIITQNGEARAVLQDVETYERNQKGLLFLKLMTQSEQAIQRRHTVSHKEFMKRMDHKYHA